MGELDPQPLFGSAVGPWHRHFALLPVKSYDQRAIWLCWCWRRCIQKHHYLLGGADFWFQYSIERPLQSADQPGWLAWVRKVLGL
jgi:hypothetical protein